MTAPLLLDEPELVEAVAEPSIAAPTLWRGLTIAQLDEFELKVEEVVRAALRRVMRQVTPGLGEIVTAASDAAAVSPDDLAPITSLWRTQVDEQIMPVVGEVYRTSSDQLHAQMVDAVGDIPRVSSVAAETYLAQVANNFDEVGAELWETARTELISGMQAGDDVPTLARRLRVVVPEMSGRTAVLVARTQVNDAANAGSYATAQASGLDLVKGWEPTADLRTRESHLLAGSRYSGPDMIPMADKFMVGGWPADRPHDIELPASERYNCRCTTIYRMRDDPPDPRELYLDELRRQHEERVAALRERHQRRLATLAARHEANVAQVSGEGREAAIEAARAAHQARVSQLSVAHQARLVTLAAEHERRLAIARGETPPVLSTTPPLIQTPTPGVSITRPTEVPVRDSLRAAQTVAEVQRVFLAEWREIITPYGMVARGRFTPTGDVQTTREHAEMLLRLIDRFPLAPLTVTHRNLPHTEYAHSQGSVLRFSNDFARARDDYLLSLRLAGTPNDQGIAWHPMGISSPQGIAAHEFGHVLHDALSPTRPMMDPNGLTFEADQAVADGVRAILRDIATERGVSESDLIKREVSGYAAEGWPGEEAVKELIAEAFADVFINGDAASALARRIFTLMVDEYDKQLGDGQGRVLPGMVRASLATRLAPEPAGEAVARRQLAAVEKVRPYAGILAEIDELTSSGASARAIATRIQARADLANLTDPRVVRLIAAIRAGDQVAVQTEMTAIRRAHKLTVVGRVGDLDIYDRARHDPLGGTDLPTGSAVELVRPGVTFRRGTQDIVISRPVVTTTERATVQEILAQRAPAVAVPDDGLDEMDLRDLRDLGAEWQVTQWQRLGKARLVEELRKVGAKSPQVVQSEQLGVAIAEAIQALEAGKTREAVIKLMAGVPRGDWVVAKLTPGSVEMLLKRLRKLADDEGARMPTAAQLKAAKAARLKVAREAAAAVRAEKARQAEIKRQVKAVERGDFSSLTRVGPQAGGMPGGLFEDPAGGRWYVKQAASDEHARSEALALALYRAAGIDAPDMVIGGDAPGLVGPQVATRVLPDAQVDLKVRLNDAAYIEQVRRGFAVDAWLANWDVVGANPVAGKGWDNVISSGGRPWRIDAGGALRFRGLGGEKPFTREVLEWDTLRSADVAARASQVFKGMTRTQLQESVARVKAVTPAKIQALAIKYGFDQKMVLRLIDRRTDLLERAARELDVAGNFNALMRVAWRGPTALKSPSVELTYRGYGAIGNDVLKGVSGFSNSTIEEIRKALAAYRGFEHSYVNRFLRTRKVETTWAAGRRARNYAADIDRAMDKSTLQEPVLVYRSLRTGRSIFGNPEQWGPSLVGWEWREPAYVSTSVSRAKAYGFMGGRPEVVLRVVVPKEIHGIKLSDLSYEGEILLDRDLRFRVVADRGTDSKGVRNLDVEVIVRTEPRTPLPDLG